MAPSQNKSKILQQLEDNKDSGNPVKTTLKTDERIIARVTDGIYREPAAAIRELISNAYDADAKNVIIHTDAPRFEEIRIIDDGIGLSRGSLAYMLEHIGGSAKRTKSGAEIGVVSKEDPELSPGGRKLIGKIGIGLFSISQLSHHFRIITKVKDDPYRIVMDVVLKTYAEDVLKVKEIDEKFNTGEVTITQVPAEDIKAQGTEIIIMDLPGKTIDELRSMTIWRQVDFDYPDDIKEPRKPPKYHIGRPSPSDKNIIMKPAVYPWELEDSPEKKFEKLYQAIIDQVGQITNPSLENTFDNYFRMIWKLSLSAPIDYIDQHPFDIGSSADVKIYRLANEEKAQASEITLSSGKTLRSKLRLRSPERGGMSEFNVILDGVKLLRPTKIHNNLESTHPIKEPIIFVGKDTPNLSSIPEEYRGGELDFEAYFLWTPKVVPIEHRGVMVRINDSSGGFYDETFMKYPVSEQTRLRQITAEVFILQGLDPALNIDRESFNSAHPHYQVLSKWVHNALRQIATKHKKIGTKIREARRQTEFEESTDKFEKYVKKQLNEVQSDELVDIPKVDLIEMTDDQAPLKAIQDRKKGTLAFDKKKVLSGRKSKSRGTKKEIEDKQFEKRVEALIQLLETYNIFEGMSESEQEDLVMRIANIFGFDFEG
jgi:hypothetical protein